MDREKLLVVLLGIFVLVSIVQTMQLLGLNARVTGLSTMGLSSSSGSTGTLSPYDQMMLDMHGVQPGQAQQGVGGCG